MTREGFVKVARTVIELDMQDMAETAQVPIGCLKAREVFDGLNPYQAGQCRKALRELGFERGASGSERGETFTRWDHHNGIKAFVEAYYLAEQDQLTGNNKTGYSVTLLWSA